MIFRCRLKRELPLIPAIALPPDKAVGAEAEGGLPLTVAAGYCWRGAEIHAGRYGPAFQGSLQQRNER